MPLPRMATMPSPIAISPACGDGPIRSSVRIAHKLDGPRSSCSLPGLPLWGLLEGDLELAATEIP